MNIVMNPISGGTIKIFQANTATQIGNTLASDSNGNFTSAAISSVAPVDVAITASNAGETPVNLYPPSPLVANASGLPVTTISTTNLGFLETFFVDGHSVGREKASSSSPWPIARNPPANITGATPSRSSRAART